jgi:hypothetical protein
MANILLIFIKIYPKKGVTTTTHFLLLFITPNSAYFSNHMLKTVFFALGDYLCVWGVDDGLGWDICKDKGGECE